MEASRARTAITGWALLLGAGALVMLGVARCPVASLTGIPCPGCGSTRSVLALAHGDVHGFLRYNPAALLMLGGLLAAAVTSLHPFSRSEKINAAAMRLVAAAACIELVIWIARWFGLAGGPVPVT